MPNWCSNTVVVGGDAAEVAKFNEWLGDGKLLLSKIIPTPSQLTETVAGFHGDADKQKALEEQEKKNIEELGFKNWYDWNIANWGTKWDVDVEVDESSSMDEQVIMCFQSAWAPPQKAISLLAEKFKKLTFRHSYFEEGVGFVGFDEYADGKLTNEVCNEDSGSDTWKQLAADEFGWEPWPDDVDEMEETEDGKVSETPSLPRKR